MTNRCISIPIYIRNSSRLHFLVKKLNSYRVNLKKIIKCIKYFLVHNIRLPTRLPCSRRVHAGNQQRSGLDNAIVHGFSMMPTHLCLSQILGRSQVNHGPLKFVYDYDYLIPSQFCAGNTHSLLSSTWGDGRDKISVTGNWLWHRNLVWKIVCSRNQMKWSLKLTRSITPGTEELQQQQQQQQ